MHRRWYWKVYLMLWALLLIASTYYLLYSWNETELLDRWVGFAALPVSVAQTAGLFGFVYQRRIGSARMWRWVAVITLLELIWTVSETVVGAEMFSVDAYFVVGMAAVLTLSMLPLLIGLCVYAFRSNPLWVGAVEPRVV